MTTVQFFVKKPIPSGPFVGVPVTLEGGPESSTLKTNTVYSQSLKKMICGYDGPGTTLSKFWYFRVNPVSNILLAGDAVDQGWDTEGITRSDCIIDPVSGHLVIGFRGPSSGVCGLHEFVGEGYIYSPETEFNSTRIQNVQIAHIPNSNKIAFVYIDKVTGFGPVAIAIGEVVYENYLGDDQWYVKMIGSPVEVTSVNSAAPSIVFHPITNQLIITYHNTATTRISYRICTIDSTGDVSFGTIGTFINGYHQPNVCYDSIEEKVVLVCRHDSLYSGNVVVGTVSGSDIIDIGSPVTFSTSVMNPASVFDSNSQKINIVYRRSILNHLKIISGKVTGNSITLDTPLILDSGNLSVPSIAYDPENKLVVITYVDATEKIVKAVSARLE